MQSPLNDSISLKTSRIKGEEFFVKESSIFVFPVFVGYIISRIAEKTEEESCVNPFSSSNCSSIFATASVSEKSLHTLKYAISIISSIFAFSLSAMLAASMT